MEKSAHILYVEDDETLGFVTRDNLEQEGYRVSHFTNGQTVIDKLIDLEFDLAILDIMLPDADGFEVATVIRRRDHEVPILFLTSKSLKDDRLKGFAIGADDYISKPFSIEELLFRVNIFLKRRRILNNHQTTFINVGHFQFDYSNLSLISSTNSRVLTQKEADLFRFLLMQQNRVCKRSDILREIWGEDDYFLGRSLDVFISKLRKYLASDESVQIENIHGVGFRLKIQT
ncbi:UNVERIFIED_CONTAM: hypothetical protein GTU68_006985 [Idotea baltica]|nr:hypothetical protein [Idotea baltica]